MKTYATFITYMLLSCLILSSTGAQAAVRSPQRTQGLVVQPPNGEITELVSLQGKGKFVSAQITKQGGTSDLTFVSLDIDGRNVVSISIVALRNIGLTESNPYGLVLLQSSGNPKTFTIGFSEPLVFKQELRLSVNVQEDDVVQILANVVHGK